MNELFKNRYKEREPGVLLKAMTPQSLSMSNLDTETHATQSEHIPEASQKSNIFGKLWDGMKSTFSETVVPATSTSPATTKEGLGHKIMKYALPALTTMGGGAGALPGLLGAFAGEAKNRRGQVEDENAFQKQSAANALKAADDARAEKQFEETKRHNKVVEGISAGKTPPIVEKRKALDITKRLRVNPSSVSDDELAWLDSYDIVYGKSND